jgi:hypothetical protein
MKQEPKGYWDWSTKTGFGRTKADWLHGMYMQPILNVITFSDPPRIEGTDRVYGATHFK